MLMRLTADMDVDNGSPQPAAKENEDMPANGGHGMADGGEVIAVGGDGTADGGDGMTAGGDGIADGGRGTPSNVSHTAPISAISDITNKVRAARESCLMPKDLFTGNLSSFLATTEESVPWPKKFPGGNR